MKNNNANNKNKNISNSLNLNFNPNATFYSHKNFNNDNSMYKFHKNNEISNNHKNKTQINFFKKSPSSLNLNININNPSSFNNISNLLNNDKFQKTKSVLNITKFKPNYKYFTPISKNFNNNNKIYDKIKYDSLKLKRKKNKLNLCNKTHFKGLESLSIKPKEIYDLFKLEDLLKIKKVDKNFDINCKQKKEEVKVEQKNEYKLDIKEIMEEEQEIQNIINTKEFSNLLGNNKFFKEVEYKNDKLKILKNSNNNFMYDNPQEKNKKMNYLKKLAFKQRLSENKNKNLNESYSDEDSVNIEGRERIYSRKNRKDRKDLETELRIDGKVYQMRNQIDKICKELLIKYKVFESVKNK